MKNLIENDTIQIEITNACINDCSNCSRHVGHYKEPFFMTFEDFKKAVDSLIKFPHMIGFQGGEPLLHPEFERFCDYARAKLGKVRLGLWSTFPKGFEHYRETIVDTFYHVFLNDHTRDDIFHHPSLVAIQDVISDKKVMWNRIQNCWAQKNWSACINPKGAFFCEMAGAFSMLFPDEESTAWEVEPNWWWRIPKDYTSQMEKWCPRCGMAIPLPRRASTEKTDDISESNLDRLRGRSPKVDSGGCTFSDKLMVLENWQLPLALYKDMVYRNKIANRYGIFLVLNEYNFCEPFLRKEFKIELQGTQSEGNRGLHL